MMVILFQDQINYGNSKFIPLFMLVMGIGIAGIWAIDLAAGKFSNQGNFFKWRNEGGDFLWTHITAEIATAVFLIIGAMGIYTNKSWAESISLVSLGALTYTSLNSLGWTFAEKSRYAYGVPMAVGLIGSMYSIFLLIS